MKHIHIVNGPNLNLVGIRQPEIYGHESMEEGLKKLFTQYSDIQFHYFQNNSEGALIDYLHKYGFEKETGFVLNAGGYTHTSVALADAVSSISNPVVEVHLSNPAAREPFRHHSFLAPVVLGSIAGFGMDSYRLGVEAILRIGDGDG